jgi:hypothetical protein
MTVKQLSIVATVLGVVAVIMFILDQWILGVVLVLLAGGAWTLTQYVSGPSGRDDDEA